LFYAFSRRLSHARASSFSRAPLCWQLAPAAATSSYAYYKPKTTELFGKPLLLCHPKATSPRELYLAVARAVSPTAGAVPPHAFRLFVAKVRTRAALALSLERPRWGYFLRIEIK
jgi:hypothetical protein